MLSKNHIRFQINLKSSIVYHSMDPSKKEEYDRLYRLLSSLSTKSTTAAVAPLKQPVISLQHCTTVSRLPPEFLPRPRTLEPVEVPLSTYEEIEVVPLSMPLAAPLPAAPLPAAPLSAAPLSAAPLSAAPLSALTLSNTYPKGEILANPYPKGEILANPYPEFTILSTYQELHEKKKKITYQCESCLKSFAAKDTYDSHVSHSIACQQWKALSQEEKQHPMDRPINELVHELLQQAIGTSEPFQCRYCNMTFVSRGNHHKHLQVAVACNRLAYLTFMRTISNLNTQHKDQL